MESILSTVKHMRKAEDLLLEVESELIDTRIVGLWSKKNYDSYNHQILAVASLSHVLSEELKLLSSTSPEIAKTINQLWECLILLGGAAAALNTVNEGLKNKAAGAHYTLAAYKQDLEQYKLMLQLHRECKDDFLSLVEQFADELAIFDTHGTSATTVPTVSQPISTEATTAVVDSKPKTKRPKAWYESKYGIGQKEGDLYLMHFEVKRHASPNAGYQILHTHPRTYGQVVPSFVPDTDIEKPVVSGRTVTSSCPKCDTSCIAELDQSLYFSCSECGCTWWQKR
jgi:ribosomal protein S27AE